MKALKGKNPVIIFVLAVLLLASFVVNRSTQAGEGPKEYAQLNAAIPLADNLIVMKGKTVTVSLSSGQVMTGIVKEVKNNLLHLEKLSQKDFYDALIRVDLIVAIEVRAR